MNQDKQKFIDKYKEIAIQQQLKYGIPASITLAQAILESSYGTSKQAKECKNFFGVSLWNQSSKYVCCFPLRFVPLSALRDRILTERERKHREVCTR